MPPASPRYPDRYSRPLAADLARAVRCRCPRGSVMRRLLPPLVLLSLAFAPAPFPKAERRPAPRTMAGAGDVKWGGSSVRLDLRSDGSARFAYVPGEAWEGSWRQDGARRLTLTLLLDPPPDYHVTFDAVDPDAAGGKVRQGASWQQPVEMRRSGRR